MRDNLALTRACIDSIYAHTPGALELVLVDNGSVEDVAGTARELSAAGRRVVYLRNQRNEGFAYGCNQGIAASHGDYLVLLNNDVVVTPGWLSRQLALLEMDPAIAVVGPTTNATSGAQLVGTATYRGVAEVNRFARQWALEHAGEFALVPRIVGLCMVMRRALVDEIGGFDTAFGFGNCEDDDLCVRILRAGHQIAIAYDAFIHHHGSATFRSLDLDARALVDENWRIFCNKWRHPPQRHGPAALAELARAAPFDPRDGSRAGRLPRDLQPARRSDAAGDGQADSGALHPRLPHCRQRLGPAHVPSRPSSSVVLVLVADLARAAHALLPDLRPDRPGGAPRTRRAADARGRGPGGRGGARAAARDGPARGARRRCPGRRDAVAAGAPRLALHLGGGVSVLWRRARPVLPAGGAGLRAGARGARGGSSATRDGADAGATPRSGSRPWRHPRFR